MKYSVMTISIATVLLATVGCNVWNKVKTAGSAPTATSFKESFLTSCGRKAPDKLQYCECFYQGLEAAKVTDRTEDQITEYIKSPNGIQIAQGCLKTLIQTQPSQAQANELGKKIANRPQAPASTPTQKK